MKNREKEINELLYLKRGNKQMTKESLEKAREIIVSDLLKSNLDILDRTELIINLDKFLNPVEYENNIKILVKYRKETK